MRFLFIISLFTIFLFSCSNGSDSESTLADQQDGQVPIIQIQGSLSSPQKANIFLKKVVDNQSVTIDSASLSGSEFSFRVPVAEPDFYLLSVEGQKEFPLILNPKQDKVQVSINTQKPEFNLKIEGSKDTDDYYALENILNDFGNQVKNLEEKYSDQPAELQKAYTQIQEKAVKKVKEFISKTGPSIVSVRASSVLEPESEFEFLQDLGEKLKASLPDSKYAQEYQRKIQALALELEETKHLQIGKLAPEINLSTPQGETLALSSLRGKLVLIDFWASWCKPCRMENPNVVRMYNTFKPKGFEIYGVSLDKGRDAWLRAIAEDNLTWRHVSDLKFWQSEAAQTYRVRAIPATFLIGPDGKIIAKNLRGPALEAKVAEVLENL